MKTSHLYPTCKSLVQAFLRVAREEGIAYSSDKPAFRENFCIFVDAAERAGYCSAKVAAKAVLPDEYYR